MIGWICFVATCVAMYLNIKKIRWCFAIFVVVNCWWIYLNAAAAQWSMLVNWIVFDIFNVVGFIKWGRERRGD